MRCSASSPATSRRQLTLTGGGRALPVRQLAWSASSASATAIQRLDRRRRLLRAPPRSTDRPAPTSTRRTKDTGFIHRLNLTYKINDDALVYATWSRGFRPGGINRRGTLPPYGADFISNYELGFKTELARQPAALQRRDLPARLERYPVVLPRRQRPHRDPQRRQRPDPRRRGRPLLPAGDRPHASASAPPTTTARSPRISARSPTTDFDCTSTSTSTATASPRTMRCSRRPARACR